MIAYVSEVNSKNFEDFSKMEGIVVIDIWAKWCNPCLVLSPIVDILAAEFTEEGANIHVGKMDVDANRDIAADLSITSIPCILIYKNGEMVDKNVGMISKVKLKEIIQKHI